MPRPLPLFALLAALVALLAPGAASAPAQTPQEAGIDRVPVTFTVRNVNRTKLRCATDGRTYRVRGFLVGPRAALRADRAHAATLYLHGLGYGSYLFNFNALPRYDYARQQARGGLVSVVIDRLGYDASGRPPGTASCLGGQATIANQIVAQLKRGRYGAASSPRFRRVVMAGHSVGGTLVQLAEYSGGRADAIIIISASDLGPSVLAGTTAATSADVCAAGGQRADGTSGPPRYAFFGQTPEEFRAASFADAEPRVIAATLPLANRNPCGDLATYGPAVATNLINAGSIRVPVLIVSGAADPLFPPIGLPLQASVLTGSRDVRVVSVPRTAHAVTLNRNAPRFRAAMLRWHRARGFTGR